MKSIGISTFFVLLMASNSWAGECKLKVFRETCPGKEAEALKPYQGKKETEEKKELPDAASCTAWAQKSAQVIRKGTWAAKKVSASFNGQDLGQTFEDLRDCK